MRWLLERTKKPEWLPCVAREEEETFYGHGKIVEMSKVEQMQEYSSVIITGMGDTDHNEFFWLIFIIIIYLGGGEGGGSNGHSPVLVTFYLN